MLVYSHQENAWKDPITASNGLSQYPALLVYHDQVAQDVWIVTPDYVFIYDQLSAWMTRHPLPREVEFQGAYSLGLLNERIILRATNPDLQETYSAVFIRGTSSYDQWGPDSTLNIAWNEVKWLIESEVDDDLNLPVQAIMGGQLTTQGSIILDGYPQQAASEISTIAHDQQKNRMFLGTYGMGVFKRSIRGAMFEPLPFGLLSPDVMTLELDGDTLLVGGRAGVSRLAGYQPIYYESVREPTFDHSFVASITNWENHLTIAARGGVFTQSGSFAQWDRLVDMEDLASKRIYALEAGNDNLIMIGTERNAYLYHRSGNLIHTLFDSGLDWPVFDIAYRDGIFYLATFYGLYVFDSEIMKFRDRVSSFGEVTTPLADAALDPIYEVIVGEKDLWASTHRGLVNFNLNTRKTVDVLAPATPFQPRGLAWMGDRVWVGSEIGLYSYNPKLSAWRNYTHNDGLISDFITDIVAIEDYIWVGTNLGLTRISWKNLY